MGGAVEYDQLSKKPLDTVNTQTIHIDRQVLSGPVALAGLIKRKLQEFLSNGHY